MRAAMSMDLDRIQGARARRRAEVDRHTAQATGDGPVINANF
jgi:hypothetical protein